MEFNYNFYLSIIIFVISYFFVITEIIDKTVAVVIGACLMIFIKIIASDSALHFVDLNVIFLLTGMMLIIQMTKKTGLFQWIAIKSAKISKGQPIIILLLFMWITAVLSAFLDNVTTILLIAPVSILIAVQLKVSAFPFLITQILASNIGGTATLIGDPPNILIASQSGLTFLDFIVNLSLPILVIMIILSVIIYLKYRKKITVSVELRAAVMSYDDSKIINNKYDLIKCLSVLIFVVLGFLTHSIFHIEPYVISLFGAFILMLLLKENPEHLFKDVEWNTLFFFIGLFILVGGLIESNVIKFLALKIITLTSGNFLVLIFTILLMSAILSAIVDNIPYVLTVIPIIKQIGPVIVRDLDPHVILVDKSPYMYALWWALSLGACLGGNGTIVGASANVIMAGLAKKNGYELSFKKFLRYGLLTTGLSILICIIYLYIKYYKLF